MRVMELWRYPVSTLGGERLPELNVSPTGVAGDRMFVVVDAESREPASPEKVPRWRKLLFLSARSDGLELPEIEFPDGRRLSVNDNALNAALTDHVGFPAMLCKYARPALEHLDMPLGDNRYKPAPLHVVSQSSVDRLSDLVGAPVDARRFRANIIVDGEDRADFEENTWIGHALRIEKTSYAVTEPTKRCGLTMIAQPDILENADILRTILRSNQRNFGAYCEVPADGVITIGSHVSVDRGQASSGGNG